MNFRVVFKLIGRILLLLAGSMVLPLVVALLYQESPFPFLSSILLLGLIGGGLSALPANNRFYAREGFFAVAHRRGREPPLSVLRRVRHPHRLHF